MSDSIQTIIATYVEDANGARQLLNAFASLQHDGNISDDMAIDYHAICDILAVGVVIHDGSQQVVYHNEAAEKILGIPAMDMNGTNPRPTNWNITRQDNSLLPSNKTPTAFTLATGKPQNNIPVIITHPSQKRLHVLISTVPIIIEDDLKGVVTTFTDVTDDSQNSVVVSKQMEEERSRILSNFMRDASHEFRTPLATIHTKLYVMMRKYEQLADSHDVMAINKYLDQLNNLVDKLELMTKLDERGRWTIMPVKLYQVVQTVIDNYRYAYAGKIILETEHTKYSVFGHEELIVTAIQQVVDNAIAFSPDHSDIIVRLYSDDNFIKVDVIDNGMGMPEDVLAQVYERFYRQDVARTRRGFGLGLSIVERIMHIHSQQLSIVSHPGQGTTVSMGFIDVNNISNMK